MVAGSGRISKMRILGTWPLGAYFVRARAVVRPEIPPPRMMMSRPSFDGGAMIGYGTLDPRGDGNGGGSRSPEGRKCW